MPDVAHDWGVDLTLAPSGDLLLADGDTLARQRVLRRLLTNLGDYIWQLSYGAGIARFIGSPSSALAIRALIASQMLREPAVASSPAPVVEVTSSVNGAVYVQVRYVDAQTAETVLLTFSVDG